MRLRMRSQFAAALRLAGRSHDAAWMWREAIRALLRAGSTGPALTSVTELLVWLVRDLHEAEFATMMRRDTLGLDNKVSELMSKPGVSDEVRIGLELITAEAEAMCGMRDRSERLAGTLEGKNEADRARLRVAAAFAAESHEAASEAYGGLARALTGEAAEDALLRSDLHAGLAGDLSAAIERILDRSGDGSSSQSRALSLGWLRESSGDFVGARSEFLAAAEIAIDEDDPYRALRALRNAERCERLAGLLSIDPHATWQRSRQIEPMAKARVGSKVTHDRFMSRIGDAVQQGQLREAYFLVRSAAFMAWQEIDPAAYADAKLRYASLMRAAAVERPSPEFLIAAVRATAEADAHSRDYDEAVRPLVELLQERITPEFAAALWGTLEESAEERNQLSGSLMLAEKLADAWQFPDRDSRIARLVCRGITAGIGNRGDGPALKALDLIRSLKPALQGGAANSVRDALVPLMPVVPWERLADLLNAIAITAAAGTTPEDDGQGILEALLGCEDRAIEFNSVPQWIGALAMLHLHASGGPKRQIADLLRTRGMEASGVTRAGWYAAERAIAGKIELPSELADRYLDEMASLLKLLRAETPKGGLGMGARDIGQLTFWAAGRASPASRENALTAAIDFLLLSGHLLHQRVQWLAFIAHLARYAPDLASRAIDALATVARGELLPQGDLDAFTTPFAFFRITGHTPEAMMADAVHWMILIAPAAPVSHQQIIVDSLKNAASHSDPELRKPPLALRPGPYNSPRGLRRWSPCFAATC